MMNKKPRVLMIGPGRDVRGGISTVVNSYFELGLSKEIDIAYLPTMEDGSKLYKLFVAAKAYVRFLCMLSRYDIVHVHMAAQASFDRKALFIKKAHRAGKKIIIHQHAADFDKYYYEQSDEAKQKKIKSIFACAELVIVLSEEWEDFYRKNICDGDKIVVLHNGVIVPNYVKEDYRDKNVLFLGRLGERKGVYDLLNAIPEVLKVVPEAKFFLGGDGEIEECKAVAKKLGIAENVHFLGWVRNEEKEEYLKKCGTYVLPSYHEGMPMSVLEAMSYGLATISTNVGGIPQVINNGVDGIRFNPGDIGALSKGLIHLLINERKRREFGEKGSLKIKTNFSARITIKKLVDIFNQIM